MMSLSLTAVMNIRNNVLELKDIEGMVNANVTITGVYENKIILSHKQLPYLQL